MKKWISLTLAALLAAFFIAGCAPQNAADGGDIQTQIDALQAEIDALREEVQDANLAVAVLREEFYEYQVDHGGHAQADVPTEPLTVAIVGGTPILNTEPMELYRQYADMYAAYGLTDAATLDTLKKDVVDMYVMDLIVTEKAHDLGLHALTDAEIQENAEKARQAFEEEIAFFIDYYRGEDITEEEARTALIADMESQGVTLESLEAELHAALLDERLRAHVVESVALSEEALVSYYDDQLLADQELYADPAMFESALTDGANTLWAPEGYRRVKHILITLDDAQAEEMALLNDELADINIAIEAETATDAQVARKPEVEAAIEAVYATVQPRIDEIYKKLEAGEDFDALMAEYGADPGMQEEPGKTNGYYVAAHSTMWDQGFTDGAMALDAAGDVSEPVWTAHGAHIILYLADVEPGVRTLEEARAWLEADALEMLRDEQYADTLAEWLEAADVEYFYENMR